MNVPRPNIARPKSLAEWNGLLAAKLLGEGKVSRASSTLSIGIPVTTCHILKQVKQNATYNLAPFSSQLFKPFQMVCFVLLTVL